MQKKSFLVRLSAEDYASLLALKVRTGRTASDAIRYSVREILRALQAADTVTEKPFTGEKTNVTTI